MTVPVDTVAGRREQVLRVAASLGALGDGSAGGSQLLAALCRPTTTAREVSRLLTREPALYARVLRVANSSYYGRPRAVTSIDKAIVLLGLDAIRGIAAAACLDRLATPDPSQFDANAVVAHGLATAATAESLAGYGFRDLAENAFLGGLIHNFGVFVQLRLDAARFRDLLARRAQAPETPIRVLEADAGLVGHEECFSIVAGAWQFPDLLLAVGRHHHAPAEAAAEFRPLVTLVSAAASFAAETGATHALEPLALEEARAALMGLGIGAATLDEVRGLLPERIAALRAALHGS